MFFRDEDKQSQAVFDFLIHLFFVRFRRFSLNGRRFDGTHLHTHTFLIRIIPETSDSRKRGRATLVHDTQDTYAEIGCPISNISVQSRNSLTKAHE